MDNSKILLHKMESIDGQDYGACQSLRGQYQFPEYIFCVDQIPKDPYAPPHTGIYRIQVRMKEVLPSGCDIRNSLRKTAFRDYLARRFFSISSQIAGARRGTGYSGIITIDKPGQAILDRSSVVIIDDLVEVRCFIGIPAKGRNIKGTLAKQMLFEELPEIVKSALFKSAIRPSDVDLHMDSYEDADYLRSKLAEMDLVAFVANASILPRESGTSDKPLERGHAVKFKSPDSLAVNIDLPHFGPIEGMGIPRGVTLIVGGGYHGKSTLLQTIEQGIYNHLPGDGREKCVSVSEAIKIRAYSGRYIEKTDISPFIRNLPFHSDTTAFSTENASGSTSQAANIVEAIEIGAKVLLMDEDTCATNFMIRDEKMQKLVQKEDEPITSFIDRIQQLYTEKGISTVLVLGGVGDYFSVADQVIQMVKYEANDVTQKAKKIISESDQTRTKEDAEFPIDPMNRIPLTESVSNLNEYGKERIYATEIKQLHFGRNKIDLTDLEQLMELSQTKAIAYAIQYAKKYMDDQTNLRTVVEKVVKDCSDNTLNIISERISGHFAQFRKFELAFALNRMRGFKVKQDPVKQTGLF